MNNKVNANLTWLVNNLSQGYIYRNESEKIFDKFYNALKENIDLTRLTVKEAKELRFGKWDEISNLWLFPLWIVPIIPEGLEVMNIGGKKYKYNPETADNDVRFGCVSYGIQIFEEDQQ